MSRTFDAYYTECSHENTIDVGDEDHVYLMCTDCGKSDRDEYQEELNAQYQANKFDHEAQKLNRELTKSDALSDPFNDDPKYSAKYE